WNVSLRLAVAPAWSCLRFRQHGLIELCLFPAFGAIGRDLDLRDLAVAAPRQTRDAVVAGPYLHHARWLGDDRVGFHPKLELLRLAVRKQLRVPIRFPARHPGLIAEFQAAQPFDVQIAFEARRDETNREAMGRPQRFAVLAVRDENLLHYILGDRTAPINPGCVGALSQHPGRSAILPNEFYEKAQRNAGPLIGAHKAMSVLDRDIWVRLFPIFPAVTGAFDEDGAGDRGHPH